MDGPRPGGKVIRGELVSLARLAAPVVAVQLGLMLMGTVDIIVCGHHSPAALSAVAVGNIYHWGLMVFAMGVMAALDPLVSQAAGARDRPSVARWFQRGLVMAVVLAVPCFALLRAAEPILVFLRQPPESIPLAAEWTRTVAWSAPALLLFGAQRQTLQAVHVVRPIVIAVAVGNVANLVGNWVLVFGHLGAPALGSTGSAWSTVIARWLVTLTLAVGTAPALAEWWVPPDRSVLSPRAFGRMLAVGVPIGVQVCAEVWVFQLSTVIVGWMGQGLQSGHQIVMSLVSLSFMVPLGIGAAAAVRVGQAIGRRDRPAERLAATVALFAGASVMTVSAAAFALFPRLLARVYSDDAQVVAVAASVLPLAAVFQIFDGTQAVASGVLRGSADTAAAAAINFVAYWIVGLPLGWLLAFRFGLGVRGIWMGLTVGLMVVAVLLAARVARNLR